jgi:hypothetical protein
LISEESGKPDAVGNTADTEVAVGLEREPESVAELVGTLFEDVVEIGSDVVELPEADGAG